MTFRAFSGDENYYSWRPRGGEKTYPFEDLHDPDGDECAPAKEEGGGGGWPCKIRIAIITPKRRKKGSEDLPLQGPA